MSLQVWLPLNGDLHNQGLSDVTVTGGTIDNNGKIGKCYLVNKTTPIIINHNIQSTSEWSTAFWAKLPSSMNNATAWETMFSFQTINSDAGTNSVSAINWASYHQVKIWDDTNHQWLWAAPGREFNYDVWHHWVIAHTANGNGVQCKIYIDGNLIGSYTNTTHQMKIRSGNIIIGGGISTGGFYLDDFRIYDHALSPLEVKHLAQGLVLHYPLSDAYIESTTNLLPLNVQNFNCTNNDALGFSYETSQNGSYTLSGYITRRPTTNGAWVNPRITLCAKYSSGSDAIVQDWNSLIDDGKERFINLTITTDSSRTLTRIYGWILDHSSGTNGSKNTIGKNMQLEFKDHATPYTSSTRNENIVYDTSGFCNNGELYAYDANGSITVESDTPRYNVSTHIASANSTTNAASGTRYIYGHCSLTNPTEMAVSFWLKPVSGGYGGTTSNGQGYFCTTNYEYGNANVGSDYQASAMNHRDGAVDINDSSSTTQCRPTFYPTIGEWHHYVITYDGQVGRVYKDGVQSSTAQFNSPKTLDSFIGVIIGFSKAGGVWRRNDACYSDFRIYTTALSADDVMALYKNAGYVDSDGNVYAYEMTE